MRTIVAVAAVAAVLALAGCINPEPTLDGWPEPQRASFSVDLADGAVVIVASAWMPAGATTAVTLVHGFSGTRDNFFHTLPEADSAFAARLAATGRAVFAIDLPGYGDSGAMPGDPGDGIPAMAEALDQVADALRSGSYEAEMPEPFQFVVGSGNSMGSMVTDTAQGLYGSFDAIMPGGTSHKGLILCPPPAPSCQPAPQDDFWMPNADPDVVAATVAGYEDTHAHNLASMAAWMGSCSRPGPLAAQDASCQPLSPWNLATSAVDVPVMVYWGDKDAYFDTSDPVGEAQYFPNATDFFVYVLEDTGHVVHNHLNQQDLVGGIDVWLSDRGF